MAVQLNIRLEPEQRDKITKLAKEAGMTLTAYILDKTLYSASNHIADVLADDSTQLARYEERIEMLTKQNIYIEEQKTKEIERLENIIAQLHEQINRKDEQIEREQEQAKNQAQAILTLTLKNETLRLETESSKKSWWKFW
ncbi:plasmid mobilization protein [Streptococcus thermophilus]|uniref:plasmid mobilization protein n=1 Tax=Streptococcus thermophilus TaxID=1308 RepID=UPI0003EFD963|nr:DUF1778 domain-containing protein [Streptococcus thermophilus]EWM60206.1 hypothetical protein Y022_10320 [Streptococcus thermophilus TH1477]